MRFVMLVVALAAAPAAGETIVLTAPEEIAAAKAVNDRIDEVAEAVTGCVGAGEGSAADCLCREAHGVERLAAAYRAAMAAHPEWRDRIVFFRLEGDATGYNIAFDGVRRQIGMELCP